MVAPGRRRGRSALAGSARARPHARSGTRFRALRHAAQGTAFLYLAWEVESDVGGARDELDFALYDPASGNGTAFAFDVKRDETLAGGRIGPE